jgi:hypothetical protein
LEVLTTVVMKSSIFWDIMPCSPLTFNGLQGLISQKIELFKNKKVSTENAEPYCHVFFFF